jgi:hypothetical protein
MGGRTAWQSAGLEARPCLIRSAVGYAVEAKPECGLIVQEEHPSLGLEGWAAQQLRIEVVAPVSAAHLLSLEEVVVVPALVGAVEAHVGSSREAEADSEPMMSLVAPGSCDVVIPADFVEGVGDRGWDVVTGLARASPYRVHNSVDIDVAEG